MIKENKRVIIIALLVMLIPVIAGLILWNRLPDTIVTHWNGEGVPDGWSGKAFTVFGLNGILYAAFGICLFGTASDPKRKNISPKTFSLVIGIMPVVSIFANGVTLANALGKTVDITLYVKLLVALVFIVIGNFIPKMRQSFTVGIKTPWTLSSEDNWNRTHRFTGKLWIAVGFVLLADCFIGFLAGWMHVTLLIAAALVPIAYSYLYYVKNGAK